MDGGGQMFIEARSSAGEWGIYPGTQLRRRHRASWAVMHFAAQPARHAAQPARHLFIVLVGLPPSAQFCRKLRDTRQTTVNTRKKLIYTDYWFLEHCKLRILAPEKMSLFYDPQLSRPPNFWGMILS